jgi:hypothetical protein
LDNSGVKGVTNAAHSSHGKEEAGTVVFLQKKIRTISKRCRLIAAEIYTANELFVRVSSIHFTFVPASS